jgi:DNA-binding NarL/FixJ family response regulator
VAASVLIVDDHVSFRATARALLEADGFDVVGEASDGQSAVEASNRLKPDLVLLDIQLPDIDGFAVTAQLNSDGHRPIVVLTSSRDRSEYGELVTLSGARGFVPKAELSGGRLASFLPRG